MRKKLNENLNKEGNILSDKMEREFKKECREMDIDELRKHALIGRICGCKDCFCCIANQEYLKR